MRNEARSIDIGPMEYTVGPTGASDAVTDILKAVISIVAMVVNPSPERPV